MVELNGADPFREGNGRTRRVFISELAQEADRPNLLSGRSKKLFTRSSPLLPVFWD